MREDPTDMSCLGSSRSCTIPYISTTTRPPCTTKLLPQSESQHVVTSSSSASVSETKNSSLCWTKFGAGDSSSILRKRRTRSGRPRDSYSKALAAFYLIYPKIFPDEGEVCPLVKIEPRSPAEKTELLQELPALISKLREAENELPLIHSNFNHGENTPSPSPSPSPSKRFSNSPGFDEESEVEGDGDPDVESFLESSDIEGGMDSILGDAAGNSVWAEQCHPMCSVYGIQDASRLSYLSAIRALRRSCDRVADGGLWSGQRMMRFKDKLKAEKKMNAMSFSSLEWLKRDEAPLKLSLKLDYEQVRSAWSGRGSLYIEGQSPQTVPDDDDDDEQDEDSASNSIASVDIGLVPELSCFWRSMEDCNIIPSIYTTEDGSRAGEDGMDRKSEIREARVLRYKEKRQSRLFSKKIRYEVRKLNAEKRPRMKGRFVKRRPD